MIGPLLPCARQGVSRPRPCDWMPIMCGAHRANLMYIGWRLPHEAYFLLPVGGAVTMMPNWCSGGFRPGVWSSMWNLEQTGQCTVMLLQLPLSWRAKCCHGNSVWWKLTIFSILHHQCLECLFAKFEVDRVNLLGGLHQTIQHVISCCH